MAVGKLLVPDAVVGHVTAIRPAMLRARGLRGLIVDLDNTLTHWNARGCAPEISGWLDDLRQSGIAVCIVSNNGAERVRGFCAGLSDPPPWIAQARKPRRSAYRRALALLELSASAAAVVGDQVFTDVFGGNRAGLLTILVAPLGRREFAVTRLVRVVEGLWLRRLQAGGAVRSL